jgi:hypothetical protein
MSTLIMSRVRKLSEDDFKSIQGSETHAAMVKWRIRIKIDKDYTQNALSTFEKWAEDNTTGLYRVCWYGSDRAAIDIYFEEDADAATFKLKFEGSKESPIPKNPPPRPQPNFNQTAAMQRVKQSIYDKYTDHDPYDSFGRYDSYETDLTKLEHLRRMYEQQRKSKGK